jgi:hypothetical protein
MKKNWLLWKIKLFHVYVTTTPTPHLHLSDTIPFMRVILQVFLR